MGGEVYASISDRLDQLCVSLEELGASQKELRARTEGVGASQKELRARTEGVGASQKGLRARMEELCASTEELSASTEELRASTEALEKRMGNLEVESPAFQKAALRFVVDTVRAKLQREWGAKPAGQTWKKYLNEHFRQLPHDWGFSELALLAKEPTTPSEAGNNASRQPDPLLVERVVVKTKDEAWQQLWKFAQS